MRRTVTLFIAAMLLLTGTLVADAGPASAAVKVPVCNSTEFSAISWNQGGSTWGKAKFCGEIGGSYKVMTDDIQTDGYCVHAQVYQNGSWQFVTGSESCGPVNGPSPWNFGNYTTTQVRLVRGGDCPNFGTCNGIGVNYFTFKWA